MAKRTKKKVQAPEAQSVEHRFRFEGKPDAKAVYVAGEFNGWDPAVDRMVKRNGGFSKKVRLAPGKHQFKFVVDGEWVADPAAEEQVENAFGSVNSVVQL